MQRAAGAPRHAPVAGRLVVGGMLGVAAAAWVVTVRQMRGMDMAAGTDLGSLTFFMGVWTPMMAAMMLPGAVPAVAGFARAGGRALAGAMFAGSYLAVWAIVGLAVHTAYHPHGALTAGTLTIAAGLYELTPLKRHCRRRCREGARSGSGLGFGISCVGSSAGLMVVLLALGAMSVSLMAIVAALVLAQKLLPPRASIDVPLALAIVALGTVVAS